MRSVTSFDKTSANCNVSYSEILNQFTEGFLELDDDEKIVFCSFEIENLFLRSRNEIVGHNFWEIAATAPILKWILKFRTSLLARDSDRERLRFKDLESPLTILFKHGENSTSVFIQKNTTSTFKQVEVDRSTEFSDFIEHSPVPQWIYDVETLAFLAVNTAAITEYGYSREEFLSMTLLDIRAKDELEALSNILKYDVKFGLNHQTTVNHSRKNGQVRRVRVEGNAITYKGRNARLIMAIDCTNRILAQEALAKSESRFKALVQNGSSLIAIIDAQGVYQYVNESSKMILDIECSMLEGKSVFDLIHPDDRAMALSYLMEINEKAQIKLPPFRFIDGKKKYRWIETILTDMRTDSHIQGIVANSRDITETVEAKIEMQKSIERYDIVSKATSDAIWDWDLVTGTVSWNRAIKGIFGYKKAVYDMQWFQNLIHPDDLNTHVVDVYKNALAKGKSRLTIAYRFKCADGNYKNVLDRSFILFDENKTPIRMIGSMQDVTHTVHHINAIEQHNKKLQEISWLQSHAVRAPLASILGLTQLLTEPDWKDHDWKTLIMHLTHCAKELDNVIGNISKTAQK